MEINNTWLKTNELKRNPKGSWTCAKISSDQNFLQTPKCLQQLTKPLSHLTCNNDLLKPFGKYQDFLAQSTLHGLAINLSLLQTLTFWFVWPYCMLGLELTSGIMCVCVYVYVCVYACVCIHIIYMEIHIDLWRDLVQRYSFVQLWKLAS